MINQTFGPEKLAENNSENGHQAALFCWASMNIEKYPELKWLFAIPNGDLRNPIVANRLKSTGVKPGIPDICLLVRRGDYTALWIELKRPAGNGKRAGILSDKQREWLFQASRCGHKAVVCFGWEHAVSIIIQYLEHRG